MPQPSLPKLTGLDCPGSYKVCAAGGARGAATLETFCSRYTGWQASTGRLGVKATWWRDASDRAG